MTTDTVGGVWSYTQELATGLIQAGHHVTLVSFGQLALPYQTAWMNPLGGLDYRPTEYRLEWMEAAERDIEESRRYLQLLVEEVEPELLHLSQYCYGDIDVRVPKIVVAHSDLVSWWVAVHGKEPEDTPWTRRYRQTVTRGLAGADVVVAPSRWMLDTVRKYYLAPVRATVVYNGRTPEQFISRGVKDNFILSVGRVWDAGKHMRILYERELPVPVLIVGAEREPGREAAPKPRKLPGNVRLLGPKSTLEVRELFSKAAIYVATSRYEPFGLSPLEAALSGCALVMNDNPVFRELWKDAALFFRKDDQEDLARVIEQVLRYPQLLREYAERAHRAAGRFTAAQMVEKYQSLYHEICSTAGVA
jgi:glycosyltransferase involved in cell wall biosynthesis